MTLCVVVFIWISLMVTVMVTGDTLPSGIRGSPKQVAFGDSNHSIIRRSHQPIIVEIVPSHEWHLNFSPKLHQ